MICPKCNTELPNEAAFCTKCGNAIASKASEKVVETKENDEKKPFPKKGCGCLIVIFVFLVIIIATIFGGDDKESSNTVSSGGEAYQTVVIGSQTWMKHNLNIVPKEGNSWCYDDNPDNCDKYGRLYDWETAMKICPKGWHLPTREEWGVLVNYTGDAQIAGIKLKATSGWDDWYDSSTKTYKSSYNTNYYGFSALPGGYCQPGMCGGLGRDGYWWSSGEHNGNAAYRSLMHSGRESVSYYGEPGHKSFGHSVRCLKNK